MTSDEKQLAISLRGASQNNLRHLDLDFVRGQFTTVTGPSGSGKSSLVIDTLFAEGQRRYIETFSPYARQFIDRMPAPKVEKLTGILPAIAIEHTNTVRTPRSTVGTLTGLNDHFKVLFANHASLFCERCGRPVRRRDPEAIWNDLELRLAKSAPEGLDARVGIAFTLMVPLTLPLETAEAMLSQQGYTKILKVVEEKTARRLVVLADRFRASSVEPERATEALSTALDKGRGVCEIWLLPRDEEPVRFTAYGADLYCGDCDRHYEETSPAHLSFNSPVGACPNCNGYGRSSEYDWKRLLPDDRLSIAQGAVAVLTPTGHYRDFLALLVRRAPHAGVNPHCPWKELSEEAKRWVFEGDEDFREWKTDRRWGGVHRFFTWLEEHKYKFYVRWTIAFYRTYTTCPVCLGARLRDENFAWRYVLPEGVEVELPPFERFLPHSMKDLPHPEQLPGWNFHEVMTMPISSLHRIIPAALQKPRDAAEALVLHEIAARLDYLMEAGLGYLTLDRLSRTLSGGELQRVTLTQALGTSLTNTLFLLDEPSIGLHPRDLHRINGIIRRVTEAGNTVIAIEHDPQVMLASNRMVDLGPGAGKEGGAIEFDGETRAALRPENSTLTTDYLTGRRRIERAEKRTWTPEEGGWTIEGASEHNLKNLTVTIPRNRFVAVAGVSGSGKSTLINDVFYRAVRRALAQDDGEPGHFGALKGDLPAEIHLIDQSPIQRNLRSTPVSFIGAYDEIRKLFAASPEAKAAGLTPGDFSFNTGSGRCPACAGTGVEVVEMQFLSDVQIPCSICAGKRFTPRVLAVGITIGDRRYTIDDILHATVREAIDLFGEDSRIGRALAPLVELGLEYLELGQPISTLSPGEGQRLKLAEFIQNEISPKKTRSRRTKTVQKVFLFDEPSSGLHFEDVRHLVALFDRLVRNGHTVVTIEHNLDVIASADWVIELGPDGGAEGGELLYEGTPEALAATRATATGEALAAWRDARTPEGSKAFFNLPEPKAAESDPLEKHAIVVRGARENNLKNITAVIPRDRFTVLSGPSGSGKSTLAFRIVFAEGQRRYIDNLSAYARSRIQPPPIPDYDSIRGIPPTVSIEQRTSRGGWRSTAATMTEIYHYARLLFARLGEKKVGRGYVRLHDADPRLFSYNTKLGACPKCLGYGFVSQSVEKAKRNDDKENAYANELAPATRDRDVRVVCPACGGKRLSKAALAVRWQGITIADFSAMTVKEALHFCRGLSLDEHDAAVAEEALKEIVARLAFLDEVGLGYLELDRAAPTLSGGEAQRIRLATQINSTLRGVCYVLDEPTIGLHPRDNRVLIDALKRLCRLGNTLLVVEHDEDTIRAADHLIDIGPGAGKEGGEIVAEGTLEDLLSNPRSPTGCALSSPQRATGIPEHRFDAASDPHMTVCGVSLRNLKIDRLDIPLGALTVVTGVSGSGKSTLTREMLLTSLSALLHGEAPGGCERIEGAEAVQRVCEVTQSPIGGSLYSCPATYVDFAKDIRALFAETNAAKERGYTSSQFSFQISPGRCPNCSGSGIETLEMKFLPDVRIQCKVCEGKRFDRDTLEVTWKGKNFSEVLDMSVDEAKEFFSSVTKIRQPLSLLSDIGLGYLKIGQPTSMISGGEAQRIKLAYELVKAREGTRYAARAPHTVYILDEPTVGLHISDVEKLLNVLKRLVRAGHTVIVVEHNLDVMAAADWMIDLGPEGGPEGGRVTAKGTPAEVARTDTHTGRALREHLAR